MSYERFYEQCAVHCLCCGKRFGLHDDEDLMGCLPWLTNLARRLQERLGDSDEDLGIQKPFGEKLEKRKRKGKG